MRYPNGYSVYNILNDVQSDTNTKKSQLYLYNFGKSIFYSVFIVYNIYNVVLLSMFYFLFLNYLKLKYRKLRSVHSTADSQLQTKSKLIIALHDKKKQFKDSNNQQHTFKKSHLNELYFV